MLYVLTLFFTLCTGWGLVAQGPLDGYMKGKGNLDLALSFSRNTAQKFDGAKGQTYDYPYKGNLLSVFAEYGLTDNFDLVATIPYVLQEGSRGFQDGGVYAKYRPWKGKLKNLGTLHVVGGMGVSFPMSDYEPTATGALGMKATVVPARLILQLETPIGLFINVTNGYNWRLDDLSEDDIALVRIERPDYEPTKPANYYTFLGKIGFPSAHYYLDAWFEWQKTKGGTGFQPEVPDLPQAYGVSYSQIGGTVYYSENGKEGAYLSSAYILSGENTSRIFRITAGVVFKF